MAMQTGENEQALRKIIDMTRLMSLVVLVLHYYHSCYSVFSYWGLQNDFIDQMMETIERTGIFSSFHKAKLFALGLLCISLLGAKGRKDEKMQLKTGTTAITCGVLLYFIGRLLFFWDTGAELVVIAYITITSTGYLLILAGGTYLSRIIKRTLDSRDIFNRQNETSRRKNGCLRMNIR